MRQKRYKSIEDFKKDCKRVKNLIHGLLFTIHFFEKGIKSPQFSHFNKIKEGDKRFSLIDNDCFEFGEEKIDDLYELGFIRLFASFESFMYEFLKEQYTRYPNSLPLDRTIQVGDILEWKTQKSSREFILDHIAIENSYDLIT